ncbi:hypothetical protein C8R43DRAFT_579147 [Mycena crocata]|nr:hypothetical protein C8R43DRAFT_579147 [Mycena crocata]
MRAKRRSAPLHRPPPSIMSELGGSTSWRRNDHDLTSSSETLRSSFLRARHHQVRSNPSFADARFYGQSTSSSSESSRSDSFPNGSRRRSRRRSQIKAPLTARLAADAQTSLTLDASLVATSFASNGVDSAAGSSNASLTSSNNFINFCGQFTGVALTNGQILRDGSCNPAPFGQIPAVDALPSVRISEPQNGITIKADTTIPLSLTVNNLETGVFVNPTDNYLSAPQQLNSAGQVRGHYHVVVEELESLNSVNPPDGQKFAFFRLVTAVVTNGTNFIDTFVDNGLPEGYYRLTVLSRAANHQPIFAPISQHGSFNDATYVRFELLQILTILTVAQFTVTNSGVAGSTPSVRRRAPVPDARPRYSNVPSTQRRVIPRAADDTSLALFSNGIATGFANDGQDTKLSGQSASLTSSNNYINFCGLGKQPIHNGQQVRTGYCNPAPMGMLPAATRMPSSKFTYPRNGDIIAPNAPLTIGLATSNYAAGFATNAATTYQSAPQELDSNGFVKGHPLIVIEKFSDPDDSVPTDPQRFVLFKGIATAADSTGVVTTAIDGLPAGFYRLSSLITTANSVPVVSPLLQRGSMDDTIFFTVVVGGTMPTNQTSLSIGSTSTTSGRSTATGSASPAATSATPPPKAKSTIGAAVGGALAGVAIIALVIFAFWLLRRRRRNAAKVKMIEGQPVVLNRDDFGPAPGSVSAWFGEGSASTRTQASPPTVFAGSKVTRGPGARRLSTSSAAPSYHTQAHESLR